jgi:hypothetical protein
LEERLIERTYGDSGRANIPQSGTILRLSDGLAAVLVVPLYGIGTERVLLRGVKFGDFQDGRAADRADSGDEGEGTAGVFASEAIPERGLTWQERRQNGCRCKGDGVVLKSGTRGRFCLGIQDGRGRDGVVNRGRDMQLNQTKYIDNYKFSP